MNIAINGALGKMSCVLANIIKEKSMHHIVYAVDINYTDESAKALSYPVFKNFDDIQDVKADVMIDFSSHESVNALTDFCVKNHIPCVIATTGQTEQEKNVIYACAKKIPIFYSANMSLGVNVTVDLVKKACEMFPNADIEIVEIHHNRKIDVPSGTALMYADAIKSIRPDSVNVVGRHTLGKREAAHIGIHSLRMGNITGIHEVMISTQNETITIKHEAHDRALFADGAISAAEFLSNKPNGLYDMNDIIKGVQ